MPPGAEQAKPDPDAPDSLPATATEGLPVLVVDDHPDVRTALGDLLRRYGLPFDLAADATSALSLVASGRRYGVVLADYRLPGAMNGLDLLAEIAQHHPSPKPASALITADFDPDLIAQAHARNVSLFHKPVDIAALRGVLGLVGA